MVKKHKLFYCHSRSSCKCVAIIAIIKIIIVNKKNVNQVVIFCLFENVVCVGSSNHIFFQCYNISLLCITFIVEK